jgi:hypothetical protein
MRVLNPSFLAVTVKFCLSDFWRNILPLKVKTQIAISFIVLVTIFKQHRRDKILQSEFKYYEIIFFSSLEFMEAVV